MNETEYIYQVLYGENWRKKDKKFQESKQEDLNLTLYYISVKHFLHITDQ